MKSVILKDINRIWILASFLHVTLLIFRVILHSYCLFALTRIVKIYQIDFRYNRIDCHLVRVWFFYMLSITMCTNLLFWLFVRFEWREEIHCDPGEIDFTPFVRNAPNLKQTALNFGWGLHWLKRNTNACPITYYV